MAQILQQPYNPAPPTGLEQFIAGFSPYLQSGTDILTQALLSGQLARVPTPTGRKVLTDPTGKTYTGQSYRGIVPPGFQLQDEMKNRWRYQPPVDQQLNQYKLQAAPYELEKLKADIANQRALAGYYAAAGQSMGGLPQTPPIPPSASSVTPQARQMFIQSLSQRALAGDEEAVAALRQLGAL